MIKTSSTAGLRQNLVEYARSHIWTAVFFALASTIELALGGVLGFVATMAFISPQPGPGDTVSLFGAAVGALVPSIVRFRRLQTFLSGDLRSYRRLTLIHRAIAGILTSAILVITFVQLYNTGFFPFLTGDHLDTFKRLSRAVGNYYPYLDLKQVDWQAMTQKYEEKLQMVYSDSEYVRLLGHMLAELNDGHTGVTSPWPNSGLRWLGTVRDCDGKAVVTAVRKKLAVPGLVAGAEILEIDGLPVDQYIKTLPPAQRSGSTEWQARNIAYSVLLALPSGTQRTVTYRSPDGMVSTVTLEWKDEYASTSSTVNPEVTLTKLESGIAVIRVDSLGGESTIQEFDRVLDSVLEARGIILDLRQNSGGNSRVGDAIAGRFLDKTFQYGTEYYRKRIPQHGWTLKMSYRVSPRGRTYDGPVVVLTDVYTCSSAEMLVAALKDSGRAIVVGRTTAGSSGNPIPFHVPGGKVRFSTGDFRRNDGTSLEGAGIAPDIPVRLTPENIARGEDSDMLAAQNVLLGR